MITKYTTKRDANGNRYTLIVDHEKRTFKKDFNSSWCYDDFVTVTKRDRNRIAEELESQGYTSI